jgi:hypothetical protein
MTPTDQTRPRSKSVAIPIKGCTKGDGVTNSTCRATTADEIYELMTRGTLNRELPASLAALQQQHTKMERLQREQAESSDEENTPHELQEEHELPFPMDDDNDCTENKKTI